MSSNGTKNLIQEIADDFVTLAEENAIKVGFVETQTHHRPRDDVFVVYEICNGFKPSSRDWIGLYSAARNGVNDYLNFQWAPRHPRDQKFPNIRGVLFPAGEVDISSSTTDKYLFMYISKANQILAESQKFYLSDADPESDLGLICVEDNEDLEDFTLIQSTPEREQGNFEVVKDWKSEEPGTSDPSASPSRKYSDHVTLTSDAANGRTLLEIFSDTTDDKAVVPYTGSGPVVLYTPKNQGLPANIVQMVKEIEEMKKPRGIFTVPFVRELTKEESKDNKEKDVDLEALQVELEYVDNNLNKQRNLVKELTSKVKNLGKENKNLNVTNEKLYRNLRNLTNDKESVESELSKCRCKIEELRTIVRLQKKGNRTLEEECRKAQEEVKKNEYQAERLISNMNLLEQEKSELEENLAEHLDINGNVKEEETVPTNEPDVDNDNEGWTVATSRKTDRKQRLIEKLEKNLVQEKEKCEQLEGKLKDCQQQIEKLQSDVRDHQREEQKLVEQICEEKNCSNELNSRVKELTVEMEKMKLDNDRLTQEVALVKRQKMGTKRHLVEREEELITRIQSLEEALKASKLINKKAKRQCETISQTFFQTSNTNTQTPKIQTEERRSLTDKICGPRQDLCTTPKKKSRAAENNEKKTQSWDDYFESFATSWWKENVNKITSSSAKKPQQESLSTPAQTSTVKQQKESPSTSAHGSTTRQQKESPTTSAHGSQRIFNFHDPLFPFPIFPLADNEELPPNQGQVEEPVDLTMIRTVGDESACPSPSSPSPVTSDSETSTSSSDSSTSSWNKQVDEEAEELIPLMGGGRYGIRDVDEIDPRERKKAGARKTAAYIVSKQPEPQSQERREDKAESSSGKSSKKSGTKKFTRRFVCHTRRFRFPGGANSSRGTRSTKGNPPASPLTK